MFLVAPFRAFFKAHWINKISVLAFLVAVSLGVVARVLQTNIRLAGMLCTIACVFLALGFYTGTRRSS